mgnify:CR=1 FL=1
MLDNIDRLEADREHFFDQAQDVLRVVGVVRIVDDLGARVGRDPVLVDHPIQGRAVAQAVLEGRRVGVYNVEFDLRLMKQSHARAWLRWTLPDENFFCLMKLYARYYGDWDARRGSYRWQSLEMAGRQCQISLPNAHRAIDDCRLTRALLHYMAS